jgi:hypothetical protein
MSNWKKRRRKNSSETPKFLSKIKLELHLESLLWRSHFDFQATEFGLDKRVRNFHDGCDGQGIENGKSDKRRK